MRRTAAVQTPEENPWTADRDRFVILLHLYTVGDFESSGALNADRIMRDLGFPAERARQLVQSLTFSDFLEYTGQGVGLALTAKAIQYIEREAGRRRSVRLLP